MLIILSPAKTLDFNQDTANLPYSEPRFINEASSIMQALSEYDEPALMQLMKISKNLATLNQARHQEWFANHQINNALQAVFAFKGEVYSGLNISDYSAEDLSFAQDRIRILSGLYGMLRPLDLVKPYRLEMGTKLAVGNAKTLYKFWGSKIADALNEDADSIESRTLVNLASHEYSRAAFNDSLRLRVITPVFKAFKNGRYSVVPIYAKKARGLMCSWAIKNRICDAENLKKFNLAGYMFDVNQSTERDWIFTR